MMYHFRTRKAGKGYWAECVELPGCRTQADSRKELEDNMAEALNLFLDEPEDSKILFPLPRMRISGRGVVPVPVAPRVALAFRLRMARLTHGLTQKRTAELMGMKGLYSYQRLDSARTANPEFETLIKIKRMFPEIDVDDLVG